MMIVVARNHRDMNNSQEITDFVLGNYRRMPPFQSYLRIFGVTQHSQEYPVWEQSYDDMRSRYRIKQQTDGSYDDPDYTWDIKFAAFELFVARTRSVRQAISLHFNLLAKKFSPGENICIEDLKDSEDEAKPTPAPEVDAFTAVQIRNALVEHGEDSGMWAADPTEDIELDMRPWDCDITYTRAPNSLQAPQTHTQSNEEPDYTVTRVVCQACKAVHTAGFEF